MKINKRTKWANIAPLVTPEILAQLKESLPGCVIFDFWQLTIGDFSEMLKNGVPTSLIKRIEKRGATVFEVVQILNACEKFLIEFSEVMQQFEIQPTPDEKQAASFCPEFTPTESLLIFTRKYFGTVRGFGEAEEITLYEYYIAKKDSFSDAIYQRQLSKIQMRKK